ncbi:MAG TPA: hypothetical protein PKC98_12465 [Candidatus Melainabacteria bacterium]|nr:hypothetical protein [Candidatus Melainabacteria bacterium]
MTRSRILLLALLLATGVAPLSAQEEEETPRLRPALSPIEEKKLESDVDLFDPRKLRMERPELKGYYRQGSQSLQSRRPGA